jgi:hypothetical protein
MDDGDEGYERGSADAIVTQLRKSEELAWEYCRINKWIYGGFTGPI